MYIKIPEIMRTDLIKIAEASEVADDPKIISFVDKLKERGQYTEATEGEIEEYDEIYESLVI